MPKHGSDLVFRYGGEEFVVILQNVEEQSAKNVFEPVSYTHLRAHETA